MCAVCYQTYDSLSFPSAWATNSLAVVAVPSAVELYPKSYFIYPKVGDLWRSDRDDPKVQSMWRLRAPILDKNFGIHGLFS